MTRKDFLIEFLGALGAIDILWQEETDNLISGRVIYVTNDPEETQGFSWHISEHNIPNDTVYKLAALLNKDKLLDIDQIKISKDKLQALYNKTYSAALTDSQFSSALEILKEIEIPMVDDGEETDIYFIHE